jgi:hypothetical protein
MAAVLRDGLRRFREDPAAGDRYRRHAGGFSWRATAEGYALVYEQVMRRR